MTPAMDRARWERLQELFHQTVALPEAERPGFLDQRCGDDRELKESVLAMVAEDRSARGLLDQDVARVAADLFERPGQAVGPDSRFGPYRLDHVLGEGGMGVVYLATRDDVGGRAAIKILRDAWLSPARRERFAAEQRTLARLDHPAIAKLFDADALPDGTPWFVMEYVEGVPLTEYCRAHGSGVGERLRLFRAVADAVQHAHLHAVIHRDLKPSNILVKPDGSVKLLDFGIAKQIESLDLPVDQTQTGLRMMTPAYAAPEQIRGGPVGVRSDVYSLGVVLYELLAGRLPFDVTQMTPGEVAEAVVRLEPPKPSALARAVADRTGANPWVKSVSSAEWADLDVLCLTAMHKDSTRRYGSVEALIRDVDHYLAGQPLDARPDGLRYRLGKFVRRNREAVLAAVLVLAGAVALVSFYTFRLTTARNEAVAQAARTERILRFTLDLFEGGDEEAGPADSLRVVTLLDRGRLQARTLDREPVIQAELRETLGGIYQKLGHFARADTLLRAALEERRRLFPRGSPEITTSLVSLGLLRIAQAKFEEAETLIRTALTESERTLPPNHPARARATLALGHVLQERGDYSGAIEADEAAVRLYTNRTGQPTTELSTSMSQLADAHFYAGQYDESDSINRLVLAMDRRLYGDRHPAVASVLINLGATEQERGNYAETEKYDRQALEINRAFFGEDHYQTASNLNMLGRSLIFQRKFDEGVAVLKRALEIRERVYGPNHPLVASTLNELGNTALNLDRYAEAESTFTRAAEIYRAAYGPRHYTVGVALSNLASVYMARKEYARAEKLYREVIAIQTRALSPDHMNTAIARIKLGRALLRQGRYADAIVETSAGHRILSKGSNPNISFLRAARRDLIAAYDSLRQPDSAARFRAELVRVEGDTTKR